MKKTAIVLGATGLIGQALVDQLAEASDIDQVIAITRRKWSHLAPKVAIHVVDFEHLENHESSFRGDFLFSCLGTTRKQAGSIEAQRKVDVDYQYRAAQLAAKMGVPHYLLVSSSMASEKSLSPYFKMKGELEQKILKLPFKRISIFQPSILIGERARTRVAEKVGGSLIQAICSIPGLRRYRPIHGFQVAAKMVQVARSAGATAEIFSPGEMRTDSRIRT